MNYSVLSVFDRHKIKWKMTHLKNKKDDIRDKTSFMKAISHASVYSLFYELDFSDKHHTNKVLQKQQFYNDKTLIF